MKTILKKFKRGYSINSSLVGIFKLIPLILILFIYSCSNGKIVLNYSEPTETWKMFGRLPQRNFFINKNLCDSITKKWEYSASAGFNYTSVTAFDSVLVIGDLRGRVHAINLFNGKKIGELKLKNPIYSSVGINGYYLIVAQSSNSEEKYDLVVYNFILGEITSQLDLCSSIENEILLIDGDIVLTCNEGKIIRLNSYGIVKWTTNLKNVINSIPSSDGKLIIVCDSKGFIYGLDFTSGKIVWTHKSNSSISSGVTIDKEYLYVSDDNGEIYKLEVKTGNLIWKSNSSYKIKSLVSFDDDYIYFGNIRGEYFCLDKKNGEIFWSKKLGGAINNASLVFKNYLVVPNMNGELLLLNKRDGSIVKKIKFQNRIKLAPIFFKNYLILGCDDDLILCYEVCGEN